MPQNVPCRFHLQGRCIKGDACQFYHGPVAEVEVCRYYQQGFCASGLNCRFRHQQEGQLPCPRSTGDKKDTADMSSDVSLSSTLCAGEPKALLVDETGKRWYDCGDEESDKHTYNETDDDEFDEEAWELWASTQAGMEWKDRSVCMSYQVHGLCPKWRSCPHPHGRFCETCQKWCLHPYNEAKRIAHTEMCSRIADRAESHAISAEQECPICLERVLDKPTKADRRFGLLSCDHAFCLACVRGWRSNLAGDADIETAVRCCPVCRQTTHFVTPSTVWPRTPQEKADIVDQYKRRLGGIECKYWERSSPGDRRCPFGTSCFYRHTGAEAMPTPRKFLSADGEVKFGAPVLLSSFLGELRL